METFLSGIITGLLDNWSAVLFGGVAAVLFWGFISISNDQMFLRDYIKTVGVSKEQKRFSEFEKAGEHYLAVLKGNHRAEIQGWQQQLDTQYPVKKNPTLTTSVNVALRDVYPPEFHYGEVHEDAYYDIKLGIWIRHYYTEGGRVVRVEYLDDTGETRHWHMRK